jgi:sulfoxide reductase heme-binding subunit YedZ
MAPRSLALNRFGRTWLKPVVLVLLILPAVWVATHWAAVLLEFSGNGNALTAGFLTSEWRIDPVATTHHFLGETAIRILLVTLAVRPVKEITGWAALMIVRRRIGLAAFFYACAHLLAYFGLNLLFSLSALWADVLDRLYITLGMAAFVLLIPLAVTSTNGMIRRLGAMRWRLLHQLIYPLSMLVVLHHYFAEKGNQPGPLIHGAILAVLLGYRLYGWTRKRARRAAVTGDAARPAPGA